MPSIRASNTLNKNRQTTNPGSPGLMVPGDADREGRVRFLNDRPWMRCSREIRPTDGADFAVAEKSRRRDRATNRRVAACGGCAEEIFPGRCSEKKAGDRLVVLREGAQQGGHSRGRCLRTHQWLHGLARPWTRGDHGTRADRHRGCCGPGSPRASGSPAFVPANPANRLPRARCLRGVSRVSKACSSTS